MNFKQITHFDAEEVLTVTRADYSELDIDTEYLKIHYDSPIESFGYCAETLAGTDHPIYVNLEGDDENKLRAIHIGKTGMYEFLKEEFYSYEKWDDDENDEKLIDIIKKVERTKEHLAKLQREKDAGETEGSNNIDTPSTDSNNNENEDDYYDEIQLPRYEEIARTGMYKEQHQVNPKINFILVPKKYPFTLDLCLDLTTI